MVCMVCLCVFWCDGFVFLYSCGVSLVLVGVYSDRKL